MTPSSKRGIGWPVENKRDPVALFTRPGSRITWLYNWSPHPTPGASSLAFVPMQWNACGLAELPANVARSGARVCLAFNEPELPEQAHMTADVAARHWLATIEPLRRRGVRCGAPAISSAGHALTWLSDFLRRVRGAGGDVDFYCLHWYGETLGQFYDYIWTARGKLGADKPVWITEFASTNWNTKRPLSREHVEHFARESVKYLETLDWVERYAWFGAMRDVGNVGAGARMFNDQGALTPLGKAYRDA